MKKRIRLIAFTVCLTITALFTAGCGRLLTPNNARVNNTTPPAITEEEAKALALEKAGLTADQVVFDRVEFDRDYDRDHYEVEFRHDRTEYSAEVDAADGTIYDWEVDYDD